MTLLCRTLSVNAYQSRSWTAMSTLPCPAAYFVRNSSGRGPLSRPKSTYWAKNSPRALSE